MTDDKDVEIARLRAQLDQKNAPSPAPAAGKSGLGGCFGVVVAIGLSFLVVTFCAAVGGSEDGGADTASTAAQWTPPEGYALQEASRGKWVGVKWRTPSRSECSGSGGSCFAVDVVTAQDCSSSLYMSISIFDAGGDNIGWTNDTAQGVQVGETTKLVFTTYENGARSARIAEVSCY